MRWLARAILALQGLLFFLLGSGLLAISGVHAVHLFPAWDGSELTWATLVALILGAILSFLGLFGLAASCSTAPGAAFTYGFLLFFFVLAQIAAVCAFFFFRFEVEKILVSSLKQSLRSYPSTEDPSVYERIVKELWDEAQRQLECCGVETFADWSESSFGEESGVPQSCCRDNSQCAPDQVLWSQENPTIVQTGCIHLLGHAADHLPAILGTVAAVFAFQVLGFCFACCLGSANRVDAWEHY